VNIASDTKNWQEVANYELRYFWAVNLSPEAKPLFEEGGHDRNSREFVYRTMTSHIDDTADGQNWSEVHLETFNIWGLLSADPLCGLHFSFFLRFLSTYDLSTGSPRSETTKRYGIHVAKQKTINKNVISTLTWNDASKTIEVIATYCIGHPEATKEDSQIRSDPDSAPETARKIRKKIKNPRPGAGPGPTRIRTSSSGWEGWEQRNAYRGEAWSKTSNIVQQNYRDHSCACSLPRL
jgi:hypothetical protein